jgi:hypothetical protein
MNYSYFEIGGQIVECQQHSTSIPSPLPSPSSFRGAPTALPVAQVQGQRKQKVAGGRKGDRTSERKQAAKVIGGAAIRAGVAILMVPDPLPLVDEIAGLVLIAGGAGLVYYSES